MHFQFLRLGVGPDETDAAVAGRPSGSPAPAHTNHTMAEELKMRRGWAPVTALVVGLLAPAAQAGTVTFDFETEHGSVYFDNLQLTTAVSVPLPRAATSALAVVGATAAFSVVGALRRSRRG